MQYAVKNNQFQKNSILLKVYSKHKEGTPTFKQIEVTDTLTILYTALKTDHFRK